MDRRKSPSRRLWTTFWPTGGQPRILLDIRKRQAHRWMAKKKRMSTRPLLFDLGAHTPTTRRIADLVREGGTAALTEGERRADEARYQEVTCRSALNRVRGHAVQLDAESLPRLHARLSLLLRAPLSHAVRNERRRRVRVGDSGEAATSSTCCDASWTGRRGRASRSPSARRPIRISRSKGTTS